MPLLDCDHIITNDTNEVEWNAIPITNEYFQCARLGSATCQEAYVLKTTHGDKSVKVKVDAKCTDNDKYGLSRIEVNPVAKLDYATSGLCGNTYYDEDLSCSLHYEANTGAQCEKESETLAARWEVESLTQLNWALQTEV